METGSSFPRVNSAELRPRVMLMPTIVALLLLEATLLWAGPPRTQVCQETLTIIGEGKKYICNKYELS